MPSDLQIEASRQNGAKLKGPVSEEGKARSARNATRHGLAARTIVLSNESQELYDQLLAAYRTEWQPQGQTETDLVVEMANARWRLSRLWAIGAAAIDAEMFLNRESAESSFSEVYPALRQADAMQSDHCLEAGFRTQPAAGTAEIAERTRRPGLA